jgi:Mg-chelatase subunit ChlD
MRGAPGNETGTGWSRAPSRLRRMRERGLRRRPSTHRAILRGVALAGAVCAVLSGVSAASAGAERPRAAGEGVVLVLDASGSMRADDGTGRSKMEAAKEALTALAIDLPDDLDVGLRVYGHRTSNTDRVAGCADTELVVPVAPLDRDALVAAVGSFEASGFTPLGLALQEAAADLGDRPGTIILVSDGIDTCAPPDPCEVAEAVTSAGVEVRIETVGFQVDEEAQAQLTCIADAGKGSFHAAEDADELAEALRAHVVQGEPVTGGSGPEDALLLEPGVYRDTITLGQSRWYAVEPAVGQAAVAKVIFAADPGGPHAEAVELRFELRRGDLLGDLRCDADAHVGVGGEVLELSVRGPRLDPERGQCARPERYLLPLSLTDAGANRRDESPVDGVVYDVELHIEFEGEPVEPVVDEVRARPQPPLPAAEAPDDPEGPALPVQAGTALVLGVLGYGVGAVVARRTGP